MAYQVHVINKHDLSNHTTISVDSPLPALADGSVRIRAKTIGITLNNKSYAAFGSVLNWWDTWPLPTNLPAPYNDAKDWGIVPAWGYGEVIESKNDKVPKGSLLWGYWPTASIPFDLKLEPKEAEGYFRDVSEHRKGLMPLYQHYQVMSSPHPEDLQAWDATILPIWMSGYLVNKYNFATGSNTLLHPAGVGDWTRQDADLTNAVVVSFASGSKTARGLVWNVSKRDPKDGPLALLEATTSPDALPKTEAKFETSKTTYDDLNKQATIDWIAKFKPSRIVVCDFGVPDLVQNFIDTLLAADALSSAKIDLVTLVSLPGALPDKGPRVGAIFMNTSPVLEAAFAIEGLDSVCKSRYATFRQWLDEKGMGDMELSWGSGIKGDNGVEGAWEKVMTGKLPRQKAMVFRL